MVAAFLPLVTFMRGAAGAVASWARYRSSAVFSRSVGSYFSFPASGSGFLAGLKSLVSKTVTSRGIAQDGTKYSTISSKIPLDVGRPTVHGVVLQIFQKTPPHPGRR